MSRSVKKTGVYKDKATSGKRIGNKIFRRTSKQKVKRSIHDEDILLPEDKSELINDYDVVDWRTYKDEPKAKRK